MRMNRWVLLTAVIGGLLATGCKTDNIFYKRPPIEEMFAEVTPGMSQSEVFKILGAPTIIQASEMFYIYDDPPKPVRLRIVLDDKGVVLEKFYEPKADLARKYELKQGQPPTVKPLEGEEGRTYPGGPLPRFEKAPKEP